MGASQTKPGRVGVRRAGWTPAQGRRDVRAPRLGRHHSPFPFHVKPLAEQELDDVVTGLVGAVERIARDEVDLRVGSHPLIEPVGVDAIRDVEDKMIALFERIAGARGAEINARDILAGADAAPDAAMWLYALTTRLPMGQADRYSVLSAPTVAARLVALRDAVETVSALVEFQLSGD